ncbi:hypothetical protein HU200_042847 [Digitaria exilis]|uniref:Uncharacterized protein n=1 Tax=Digitaria exilis TaxID=1010633 RepID=A0A835EC95_9POAL|nr:hypothetical protein HU200_042847 [Digitaria exilis]
MAAQIPRCPTTPPTRTRHGPRTHGPQPHPPPPQPAAPALAQGACNPTRRGGAGRGVAPGRRGSEESRRSGAQPAETAVPFLIAAALLSRAWVSERCDHWPPRIGGNTRRRRPHAVASHLN